MAATKYTYHPINAYGVIGDCHSAVLVAPDGSIDWGCLPDFDSPALFCRLLDGERGGYFQIAPTDSYIPGLQSYIPESNVLQTRFTSIQGEILLTDFMPVESLIPWPYEGTRNDTWRTDDGYCHSLVRIVECSRGEMDVTMRLKVTPNYGMSPSVITYSAQERGAVISGTQHVALLLAGAQDRADFTFSLEQGNEDQHQTLVASGHLQVGERLVFVIGVGKHLSAALHLLEGELPQRDFIQECEHTITSWQTWINSSSYHGPYSELVRRSALALKLMTYAPTGAIVAAPTTSLPEQVGGERNWDYRYIWLRDATFTLYAFNVLGFQDEAYAFTQWLRRLSLASGEELQIMYGIRGERDLPEIELDHLSGYRESRPVRIGNGAVQQKQMDIFGEVLDCMHLFRSKQGFERAGETLAGPFWELMRTLVEHVCDHWQDTDRGIWEVRGEQRHYVYSKVMCWVALDRGIRAAQDLDLEADLERWQMVRDIIRTDILTRGYNTEIGAFTQAYDDTTLDAANLMLPLVGFIAPDDPRMRSTVDRTIEMLSDENGFLYRYLGDDGLDGHEGTFAICTFWLVDNLAMQGRLGEARSLFERLIGYAGHLGLFSEEIDSRENVALGNYPQAFTHIALINSANNLAKAERRNRENTDPVIAAIKI